MTESIVAEQYFIDNDAIQEMLRDGRNIELAARIICGKKRGWKVGKDPEMPTRTVVFIHGKKHLIRAKTRRGFDLAPAKMKGTQRNRREAEAAEFSESNLFLLIDSSEGLEIRFKIIENPRETMVLKI